MGATQYRISFSTGGLLASVPRLDQDRAAPLAPIRGQPPDPARLPVGCAYAPRCRYVQPVCREAVPAFVDVTDGRGAACVRTGVG